MSGPKHNSAGAWAKKFHFAARSAIDAMLRPYDLGLTQWYVLWHLVNDGPMTQRDLLVLLQVEKPTLSGVISTLVRKGLIERSPVLEDRRQKRLSITPAGQVLWEKLPDPIEPLRDTAFEGISENDLATVVRVLRIGTERLQAIAHKGPKS